MLLCRGSSCLFQVFQGQVILSFVGSRHRKYKNAYESKKEKNIFFPNETRAIHLFHKYLLSIELYKLTGLFLFILFREMVSLRNPGRIQSPYLPDFISQMNRDYRYLPPCLA